jgi:predicted MFS family arabinose efflux permease
MTAITQADVAAGPGAQPADVAAGPGLARYRAALRVPGALPFAIPGVIGRLPMGMLSLAQVMLVVAVTGSYGMAGAVSTAGALLYVLVTPRVAGLTDRYGQARVLCPLVVVFAVATAAFAVCAVSRAPEWTLFVTGGLSRGTMPALGPVVRARWSQLLTGSGLLDAAFSLEGIADEVIFITGPVLVVALVSGFHPVTGVLVTLALSVAGVAGLTRQRRTEPPVVAVRQSRGSALRNRGLRVLVGMHACLGAMFAAVDLATVAFAQEHGHGPLAGLLLGLYGLGSAIAGVWYGSRCWRAPHGSRLRAALAATVLGLLPLAFMPGIWPLAIAITAAGLGISATLVSSYSIAELVVPAEHRTAGMSWLTSAASAGTALGAPLAGRLIDAHGAAAGYLFAFAAGLGAIAITTLRRRDLAV